VAAVPHGWVHAKEAANPSEQGVTPESQPVRQARVLPNTRSQKRLACGGRFCTSWAWHIQCDVLRADRKQGSSLPCGLRNGAMCGENVYWLPLPPCLSCAQLPISHKKDPAYIRIRGFRLPSGGHLPKTEHLADVICCSIFVAVKSL